ncbi:dynamin-related protein 3B-like [Gossypium arboreum]|uniref:dynamin-related protein 3B-like n=1 Tax=Gossypium arboreum TaxID=29729 RepID=UPI0022F16BB1|nr:dynamin-related protein 3B-like [Gossypium arboreum]
MAEEAAVASTPPQSSVPPLGSSVIPLVNKLQDIFAKLGSRSTIELPQWRWLKAGVGKSGVLESLVGHDFLPHGSDKCASPSCPSLLRTSAEMDREAGGNKSVSDKQIRLKIFSPNVLDITLVDFRGITKVPVANSDALEIAGNTNPDGKLYDQNPNFCIRLDIMDRGTDACNLLLGKVIPFRLGYIGVVNCSQEDILLNRSINDALVAEEKFFRSRPVYNGLADRCGVPQLAKKLNQEVDPCEGLTDDDIRTAIQRSSSIYTWLIRWVLES